MRRREFLSGLALGGVGSLLLRRGIMQMSELQGELPNIIMVLADDMRWDALGVMGNRIIRTPNIDALGRDGCIFSNNFVTTSICPVSRASIMTGQYAHRHGIWDFKTPLSAQQLDNSFPVLLRKAGYSTGFIGKWGVGDNPPSAIFDYWQGFSGQGNYWDPTGARLEHLTAFQSKKALEFLTKYAKDRNPFYLSICTKAPHAQDGQQEPYQIDPKHVSLYEHITIPEPVTGNEVHFKKLPSLLKNSEGRNRWMGRFDSWKHYQHSVKQYYRLIAGIDDVVGDVVNALKQNNCYENTCIIFTSDNGYMLGEHGLADKWFGFEESIRTPMILKPTFAPYRPRIEAMTLNIDLCPTILNLAGVEIPSSVQGQSLLPLLKGETQSMRKEWFYEHLFEHPAIAKCDGVRTEQFKLMRYYGKNGDVQETLFDVINDPFEERSLFDDPNHTDTMKQLKQVYESLKNKQVNRD